MLIVNPVIKLTIFDQIYELLIQSRERFYITAYGLDIEQQRKGTFHELKIGRMVPLEYRKIILFNNRYT
ncbi:hypothetical protein SAXI111661_08770 [Saccharomonospora xinjiangensis]|nr:hypothetical protein EYD13_16840 [Saccharomonospora xinjiangensis]